MAAFVNPSTCTAYRLVAEADGCWRITKSRTDGGRLRLAHLRGRDGTCPIDGAAVARLVAGHGSAVAAPSTPSSTFVAVILADLEGTAEVLTAVAREAEEVYRTGCRGFRPRSSSLREQRDRAMARAVAEMRLMAKAWRSSGLESGWALPDWLAAALDDLSENPEVRV